MAELYADKSPKDRGQNYRDLLKKIRMGAVRGQADPLVDVVMSSTSNAQKVRVITEASESMSAVAFNDWLLRAVREDVISSEVRGDVRRALQRSTTPTREPAAVGAR